MNHFINTNATDIARAKTVGLANLLPAPFPVLTVGGQTSHNFFFASDGVLESWSGNGSYTLKLTVGDVQSGPTGGVSPWTFTVGSDAPVSLPWNIDAAGLEFALNNEATIAAEGGVDVTQQGNGFFLIAWRQLGVVASVAVSTALLAPDVTGELVTLATGSASVRNLLLLNLRRNGAQQLTTFTTITSPYAGWTGVLDLNTASAFELLRQKGELRGEFLECDTLLTLEVTDPSNNRTTYYQTPVTLRALNYSVATSQTSLPLPIGPTYHAQSSSSGEIDVAPASRIHSEYVTVAGAIRTSSVVLLATGLGAAGAGAKLVLRFILPTTAITLNVYDQTTGGALLVTIGTDPGGYLPAARVDFVWTGTNWVRDSEILPAFGQQT